ncbi:hypothetical protein BGX28_002127 [Mortierella sp. GBA30]|nr:hypothetical protein BGX28_002127 [Mortierella sp. GBA30]
MPPRKKSAAAKGPTSIAEGLSLNNKQGAMSQILDRLENLTDKNGHLVSELFVELPDREDYPDYYKIIQNPIALDIIKGRLETGEYNDDNITNFGKDLRTLTANAKIYNREGSMVYRDATTLEFSADFCRQILGTIKNHEDKTARQMAELFLELPSEEEYPDYYEEISKPIAIDNIEEKISQGAYQTLEAFEKDVNLMFENAKQYNAEGSDVYLDAVELQQLFWKTIGKNGRGRQTKGKRARKHDKELPEVVHNGETYRVGDFVHIQNEGDTSKPTIGLIFSIWEDEKEVKGLDAVWFLRPENIVHPYASRFYPSEVVKASGVHEHLVEDVVERCFVLQPKDYIRGRPDNWKEGHSIYVCEQRYNESYKSVTKIKNWASCLPPGHKPTDIQLVPYPQPLTIKKLPSASMVDKAGRQDTSEPASRASTPGGNSATSQSWSPESESKPTPKTTKSNKRKSAQLYPDATTLTKQATAESGEQQQRQQQVQQQQFPIHQIASVARQPRPASPSMPRFRCNFSNLDTKKQCAAVFTNEMDLQRHVADEHASVLSQASPIPAQKRGRPKKGSTTASIPDTASPPTPTSAPPTMAPPVMGTGAYPSQAVYNPYPSAYSTPAQGRPALSTQGVPTQSMYSGAAYQPQPMHYMQQQQQQRSMSSYPQSYGQQPMHSGQMRSQGYSQSVAYSQYGQQPYPLSQHSQHQSYAYGHSPQQFQQGGLSSHYATQQQSAYAQPYPTSQHVYAQQQQPQPQHYQSYTTSSPQQPQQHRHLPPPVSGQGHVDHQQLLAHQQQVAQQQRLAQQQQLVQQQYLQQQLAQSQAQPQSGYHQRSLSQSQGAYSNQHQQYQPHSPASMVASQPHAAMNSTSSYQQQPYLPPTSLAYNASGHSASLSNASTHSHGSVSTVTNALEGVGLGLTGVTNSDHGRVVTPSQSTNLAGSTDSFANTMTSIGYGSKGVDAFAASQDRTQALMFSSAPVSAALGAPATAASAFPKPNPSVDYMATKRQRLDSGLQPGGQAEYENSSFLVGGVSAAGGNVQGSTMGVNMSPPTAAATAGSSTSHSNGSATGGSATPVVLPGIDALTEPLDRNNFETAQ